MVNCGYIIDNNKEANIYWMYQMLIRDFTCVSSSYATDTLSSRYHPHLHITERNRLYKFKSLSQ